MVNLLWSFVLCPNQNSPCPWLTSNLFIFVINIIYIILKFFHHIPLTTFEGEWWISCWSEPHQNDISSEESPKQSHYQCVQVGVIWSIINTETDV